MQFIRRSLQGHISVFSFAILLATVCFPLTPTFAQTPSIIPTARLLSLSNDATLVSRPRRVFDPLVAGTVGPALSEATDVERRAFESTNAARLQNGLAPLEWDRALCRMARVHSENMVRQGYFAHETPEGERLRDRAHAVGIAHFRVLGENIAYNQGYDDPGAFAVERWMISPGHRANILNNEFAQSAIGSFIAPDGTVYLTQEFIKR
ncbi:MAG: SCP-like extracellular [Acidobacteria bacterium]|nr:SCP-like extracellular [Acidobacteriota bacterium]